MNGRATRGSLFKIMGISLPTGVSNQILIDNADTRVVLARPSDDLCHDLDISNVLAGMILRGLVGDGGKDPSYKFSEGLEQQLQLLRAERRDSDVLLLVETRWNVTLDLTETHREHDGGLVTGFDLYDKSSNDEEHDRTVTRVVNALTMVARQNVEVSPVVRGGFVYGDDRKRYFSYSFTTYPPKLIVSKPFTDISRVTALLAALQLRRDLDAIAKLLADSASQQDAFKAWLAAWTALEMLVQKRFRIYEKIFYEQILARCGSDAERGYIERIREIAGSKHSLVDKFRIAAMCLFPSEATDDIVSFAALKKTRDAVIHRGEEPPSNIGQEADHIRALLRRYLDGDIARR